MGVTTKLSGCQYSGVAARCRMQPLLCVACVHLTTNLQSTLTRELEITAGTRPFSDQNGKTTDQIPICLDMNPTGFLLCPSKSYHARTECSTKTQSLFLAL